MNLLNEPLPHERKPFHLCGISAHAAQVQMVHRMRHGHVMYQYFALRAARLN